MPDRPQAKPGDAKANPYAVTPLRRLQSRLAHAGVCFLARWVFRLRIDVRGLQHVPPGEPLIVAVGPHRGWLDTFLIMATLPPLPRVYFLGSAQAIFKSGFQRAVVGLFGGVVPVSTLGESNREALERSLEVLAAGNRLAIFPEGWGSMDESPSELRTLKRGVAFLSEHSGCRVIPAGIAGTQELWRGMTLRVVYGAPLPPLPNPANRKDAEAYTATLAGAIRDLMPPLPPHPPEAEKQWRWMTDLFR